MILQSQAKDSVSVAAVQRCGSVVCVIGCDEI